MNELTADRFDEFFSALWGRPAFAWQRELAKRVISNAEKPWPDAIALPTASGKTACLDVAVYALATQAERLEVGLPLNAPRRLFFAVDRRIIVDEAYVRARALAARLRDAKNGILRDIADRLRLIARGEWDGMEAEDPLAVFELRGGMYRSEAWARSPLQPTIVASTVDQLGSRLLFRAYGRGNGMWPVYAGLAGNDSLILLDEAHCAKPFLETLQAVSKYRDWAEQPLPARFYPVVMSATPPPGLVDVFRDNSGEPVDPTHPLGKRQLAAKPAALRIADKAKGKKAAVLLAKELARVAEDMARDQAKAIVIFVNRVITARETHRLLAARHDERSVLLTGRMRPIDKDDTVMQRLAPLSSGQSAERRLELPVFVVATQTLEVGADLDFDALVTECASLDALRQRFGRLNRMGRPMTARAAILVRGDQADNTNDDPVYGAALANTWTWLNEQAGASNEVDFGIASLGARLPEGDVIAELNAPSVSAPVMLPAHVDCWVQTAPAPMPTPDVALFLRGPERGGADVRVCWRADLDLTSREAQAASIDVLTLCPPAAAECLPVPIGVFRRWMVGKMMEDETADVEAAVSDSGAEVEDGAEGQCVVRWRGRKDAGVIADPRTIRPGDVVVLPVQAGGWSTLGDLPAIRGMGPVLDWGDRAYRQTRAKALLRLHPAVIDQWSEGAAKLRVSELINEARDRYEEDREGLVDDLRVAMATLADDQGASGWLREVASALAKDRRLRTSVKLHPLDGLIIKGNQRLPTISGESDTFSDEDDASASGTVPVPLRQHLRGVAAYAKRFAMGCGLEKGVVASLERAGMLHDLGKADPRFQVLLHGGITSDATEPLAKSGNLPESRTAYQRTREAAGYPEGARHELLSVSLSESVPDTLPEDADLKELVLHLIASHHGHCRPFAPVIFDDNPVEIDLEFEGKTLTHSSDTGLERLDSGVAERFWHLTRRYGWWGLAWMEAILRLADHRRSEGEAMQAEDTAHESD